MDMFVKSVIIYAEIFASDYTRHPVEYHPEYDATAPDTSERTRRIVTFISASTLSITIALRITFRGQVMTQNIRYPLLLLQYVCFSFVPDLDDHAFTFHLIPRM